MPRKKSKKSKRKSRSRKPTDGLTRWFKKERWINICRLPKIVPCGRKKSSWKDYPYCRPLKRISPSTPKTVGELSKAEIKRRCSQKRRSPRKRVMPRKKSKSRRRKSQSMKSVRCKSSCKSKLRRKSVRRKFSCKSNSRRRKLCK